MIYYIYCEGFPEKANRNNVLCKEKKTMATLVGRMFIAGIGLVLLLSTNHWLIGSALLVLAYLCDNEEMIGFDPRDDIR